MWSTRSELFTDSRREHTQRPVFPVFGAPLTRVGIRLFLSAATALVCVWSTPGSAAGAERDVDAGADARRRAGGTAAALEAAASVAFRRGDAARVAGRGGTRRRRADHRRRRAGEGHGRRRREVRPSGGRRAVAQAAVAAARQFTFEPGEAAGKPVPVRISYTYHFAPKPPPAPPPPARRAGDRADRAARRDRVAQGGSRRRSRA